jgi:hypothetical protein
MSTRPYHRDYLELHGTADNSLLLAGASASTFSQASHDHDGVYEPASGDIQTHITTVSGNPHDVTYSEVGAASTDHNHDDTYLALHGTADDSALFNGASASEYATAGHDHDGVYEPASSDIQTHITAISGNPHDVTYTEVGAASADHIHDMEDVIVDTTLRLRPQIDFGKIQATSKPTLISRGVLQAYSLPIYNSDNEELFINQTVPKRWDGASDIIVGCDVAIDTANDSKNFRLELAWENITTGDVIPTTSNAASTDTNTGTSAAQYTTYDVQFTIDYDIDGVGNEIAANDVLAMRLRRVDATSDEITGEVLVYGFYVQYNRDKIGP